MMIGPVFMNSEWLDDVQRVGGGVGGGLPPAFEVFCIFFQDYKTSASDVFTEAVCLSLAGILRQVSIVTRYDVISSRWSSHF